jgi:hypothetical protein
MFEDIGMVSTQRLSVCLRFLVIAMNSVECANILAFVHTGKAFELLPGSA